MKYLRTFLLVLLTVLLPIRGAVAAAMLCPGGAEMVGAGLAAGHAGHDMSGQDLDHDHVHVDHAHTDLVQGSAAKDLTAGGTLADAGHATSCQFCADGCCVMPLAFTAPTVAIPHLSREAAFPALKARVPAHYPEGQDRPPRTI